MSDIGTLMTIILERDIRIAALEAELNDCYEEITRQIRLMAELHEAVEELAAAQCRHRSAP